MKETSRDKRHSGQLSLVRWHAVGPNAGRLNVQLATSVVSGPRSRAASPRCRPAAPREARLALRLWMRSCPLTYRTTSTDSIDSTSSVRLMRQVTSCSCGDAASCWRGTAGIELLGRPAGSSLRVHELVRKSPSCPSRRRPSGTESPDRRLPVRLDTWRNWAPSMKAPFVEGKNVQLSRRPLFSRVGDGATHLIGLSSGPRLDGRVQSRPCIARSAARSTRR